MVEREFTAGLGLWRQVRKRVEYQRWRGDEISLFEGSGWITRAFAVRGSAEAVRSFSYWLDDLARRLEGASTQERRF